MKASTTVPRDVSVTECGYIDVFFLIGIEIAYERRVGY
jgi:hypothetical protein